MDRFLLARRLGLALCSGYLTWPAGALGERLEATLPLPVAGWSTVLIGAVFGLLVMAPHAVADAWRAWRIAALVASSIAIYAFAVWLAIIHYGPLSLGEAQSIVASGVVGAALTAAAVMVLAPLRPDWRLAPSALLAGLVGGIVFYHAIGADSGFLVASGHAAWQLLVCAALALGGTRA